MENVKVGIITFHCSYNYGSALQAYALSEYIKRLGHDARIIDYIHGPNFSQYAIFRTKLYRKYPRYLLADVLLWVPHRKRKKAFEAFQRKYMPLSEKRYSESSDLSELNEVFDAFVCGSDQIWNVDCTDGAVPAYFLSFVNDDKKRIAYAPSVAHLGINAEYKDQIAAYLSKFDAVSVRESCAVPYFHGITDKEIHTVVDPVLLWDESFYQSLADQSAVPEEKYLFVYVLERNSKIVQYAREVAKATGRKVYYIMKNGVRISGFDKNCYGVSPETFLGLIRNAEQIITNSFHAMVFSLMFQRELKLFLTQKSYSRMTDFLMRLGIANVQDANLDLPLCITGYDDIKDRICKLRAPSEKYLNDALKGTLK